MAVKIKYISTLYTQKKKKVFREKDRFQICLNTAKHRRTKYIHYPAAEYRVKKAHEKGSKIEGPLKHKIRTP